MKILWITNTIFPAVCEKMNLPISFAGGWMYSGAQYLLNTFNHIELGVASLYDGKSIQKLHLQGITYFLLPRSKPRHLYDPSLEFIWKDINNEFDPDVVHIHGTEYPHGLAYLNACGNNNVIVSIQGLVHIIERYYYGGVSTDTLLKNVTLRDLLRNDTVFHQRKRILKRAIFEILLLKQAKYVIGRTSWDKIHAWSINPEINYFYCGETLRSEFYQHVWNYERCIKYSIFVSQANYPLKGLHQLIKSLPLILREFPDAVVYVAGNDFIISKNELKMKGYGKYVRSLMKKLGVSDKIHFTGPLTEMEMCKKYLDSNVFVCPSSIENSSNSVGEAQLLGVPCVASYVGGMTDLILNEKTGLLYRFEEVEMLAQAICRIFSDTEFAKELSINERLIALKRHDHQEITQNLNAIYNNVCKK